MKLLRRFVSSDSVSAGRLAILGDTAIGKAKLWRYPEAFRVRAIDQFSRCENVGFLAKELGIPRQTLYRWHEQSERAKFVEQTKPPKDHDRREQFNGTAAETKESGTLRGQSCRERDDDLNGHPRDGQYLETENPPGYVRIGKRSNRGSVAVHTILTSHFSPVCTVCEMRYVPGVG